MTIIAAYADPGVVDALMMIPALDHGSTSGVQPAVGFCANGPPAADSPPPELEYRPVREVTRTVMLPFPASARCTKENWSVTAPPPGPVSGAVHPPHWPMLSSANPVGSAAATRMVMIQPGTVRNFVHSARSSRANRSRGPALSSGWCVPRATMMPPPPPPP